MLLGMIGDIKVSRHRFRCVVGAYVYVTMVFAESVTQSSLCFADVYLFAKRPSYVVGDTG